MTGGRAAHQTPRVLSLLPAATEIVAALGAIDRLVGITHECDFPPAVRTLPRVTRSGIDALFTHEMVAPDAARIDAAARESSQQGDALFRLEVDRISALRPDVIITQALCDVCAVSETDVRALARTLRPAPRVVTLGGTTLEGIHADVARVADALDCTDEANELLAGWNARFEAVAIVTASLARRKRVLVIEWPDPVYAAGHWVPDVVTAAGGIDVVARAGEHSRAHPVSTLRATAPDVVIVAPCGYTLPQALTCAHALRDAADWDWARDREWWALDANGLTSRPGPRVITAIETIARMLTPTAFTPLDPAHGVRVG
jgi:iron complex transport system substrate-binding protein